MGEEEEGGVVVGGATLKSLSSSQGDTRGRLWH